MEFLGFAVIVVVGFLLVLRSRRGKQDDKQTGDETSARWNLLPFFIPPLITGGPMLLAKTMRRQPAWRAASKAL